MRIKELLREMKFEVFKNILLTVFLQSVIIFFLFDMFKSIFDISYVFSYLVAGGYFLVSIFRKMKSISVKVFEKHNSEMNEMISTAADNLDTKNMVVESLFEDVIARMKKVSSGTLIVPGSILIMVLIIPVLAVVDYEMNPLRIDALSQDKLIEALDNIAIIKNFVNKRSNIDGEIIDDELLDEDIFGERSIATLGDEEIEIKMNLGFETDLTKPKEEDQKAITFNNYPEVDESTLVEDSATLEENIKESDLARKYNERIRSLR